MIFRVISTAIFAGLLVGLFLFLVQRWTTLPLIRAAETYETRIGNPQAQPPSETGFEKEPMRSVMTLLGDVFVALGFGLILTAFFAWTGIYGWSSGLLWGAAGFAVFHLGPALIVPPALPGMEVAMLSLRQIGWLVAAASTGIGLALFFTLSGLSKFGGIPVLLLPIVVFRGLLHMPLATTSSSSLAGLEQIFVVRSLGLAFLFWIVLGTVSGYLFAKAENDEVPAHRIER